MAEPVPVMYHRGLEPPLNLAIEEALAYSACAGHRRIVARIWVNPRSIIIGRTLKPCEEVYCEAAEELRVGIYRRITGGGAVYHDEGNINITVAWRSRGRLKVDEVYRLGTSIILMALERLGVEAWVENTSDVVVQGWKVSGSAAYASKCANLFHATLLVEADMETLRRVIKPRLDRIARGEVTPAKYRPGNLAEIVGISMSEAFRSLEDALNHSIGEPRRDRLTELEELVAQKLYHEKYSTEEWNIKGSAKIYLRGLAQDY
ncbi:MAG: lipoate--protein ligase family protein [Desulfurococcales archaeon]|nr:lipoate--protein ligase family protein [Desulfurococcales archaeon]